MKKYLFHIICLIALVLNMLPAVANDYLTIHFRDGHTERHFMKFVEAITTSKFDMYGNLHEDYQMQQLVINGTTYSYPLTDIDSISFHKVDEEQVRQNVENIYSTVKPIFDRCPTIEKMAEHLDEIKNIEGVEEVSQSETDIVIRVRDWYDIYFTYPITQDSDTRSLTRMFDSDNLKNLTSQIKQTKEDGSRVTVAIAFQMGDDTGFANSKRKLLELRDNFTAMGFEVHFIPDEETGEKFDVDFYERRMFDYDIVILDTHGSYHHGKHGFYTAEKKSFWYDLGAFYELVYDMDDISYGILDTGTFTRVSENFIKKSDYKFKSNGPHIFFNASCKNLSGDGTLTAGNGKSYKGSDVFAEILFEKGLDIYLGYNNSTNMCGYAARDYFTNMLKGASNRFAFDNLDDNLKVEIAKGAVLIDLYNKKSAFENLRKLFIVKTHTIEKTEQEIKNEYNKNKEIEMFGITTSFDPTFVKMGFEYSSNSDFSGSIKVFDNVKYEELTDPRENGNVQFKTTLTDLKPGNKYYYRAITKDDENIINYGETYSLTIPSEIIAGIIQFKDQLVKELCVKNWDKDGDGELSYDEAASVTSIETVFYRQKITSFNELQFFTGLKKIYRIAFFECSSLTSIMIPDGVTYIGDSAFEGCSSLIFIKIPDGVSHIGEYAFRGCSSLTSFTIPNSVTDIPWGVFMNCSGLTSVTIPNGVTRIQNRVFWKCSSLTSITIPEGVTSILTEVFSGCSSLTSITLPMSLTNIGSWAFSGCSSIKDVFCMATKIPDRGDNIFSKTPIENATLHVQKNLVEKYKKESPWKNFKEIVAIE